MGGRGHAVRAGSSQEVQGSRCGCVVPGGATVPVPSEVTDRRWHHRTEGPQQLPCARRSSRPDRWHHAEPQGRHQPADPGAAQHHHLARCCSFGLVGTTQRGGPSGRRDVSGLWGALGCWSPAWQPKQMGGSRTGMGPAVAAWSPEQCDPLQKGAIGSPAGLLPSCSVGPAERVAAQAPGRRDLAQCLLSLPGFFPLPKPLGQRGRICAKGGSSSG